MGKVEFDLVTKEKHEINELQKIVVTLKKIETAMVNRIAKKRDHIINELQDQPGLEIK